MKLMKSKLGRSRNNCHKQANEFVFFDFIKDNIRNSEVYQPLFLTREALMTQSPATRLLKELTEVNERKEAIEAELVALGFFEVKKSGNARPYNEIKLPQLIPTLLSEGDFTLEELVRKILENGYQTESKNFSTVVYQNAQRLVQKGLVKKIDDKYHLEEAPVIVEYKANEG